MISNDQMADSKWRSLRSVAMRPVILLSHAQLVKVGEAAAADWEGGGDRELTALGPEYGLKMACKWNQTSGATVESFKIQAAGSSGGGGSTTVQHHQPSSEAMRVEPAASKPGSNGSTPQSSGGGVTLGTLSSFEEEARGSGAAWVGADVQFVRSRKEAGSREGRWSTEGLSGPPLEIVQGDQKSAK